MKKIIVYNNGVKANEFKIEDREARKIATAIANREHHIKDFFDEIIGYDNRGNEVTVVKIKSVESA